MPVDNIVEVEGLVFAYGDHRVIDLDRLAVPQGTITAVIGPNGCGKTTLFKLINGLLPAASGAIRFAGSDIATAAGRRALRARTFYVHQKPYIFRRRVRDNVAYGLKVRGVGRSYWADRIEAALAETGIDHLSHRHGHALSGGEKQRLALARALALRPSLLLLDEPTSNIDPKSVAVIEAAVVRARAAGATVLISTHNLATAYRIADVVLPMEAGTLHGDRNNVYHGELETADGALGRFVFPEGKIATPAVDGEFSAAVVPMDDVILSKEAVISSAQNSFRGIVINTQEFEGLVRVVLDCGFPLSALVTDKAVAQLGIERGATLYAGFKASAVRLY